MSSASHPMNVDAVAYTPLASLAGGVLIGLAAAILVLVNGRVAGISGILAGLVGPSGDRASWRFAFVGGLLLAPVLAWTVLGSTGAHGPTAQSATLVASGLLVGIGTRIGGGCTSGHGVCGLSRFSPRSLVATLVFMAVGVITAVVMRNHV